MPHDVRIAVSCADRTGLLAAICARLFELGGNLGDASFAVLGEAAEFTCVCELPDTVSLGEAQAMLEELPELSAAQVAVTPFVLASQHAPSGRVTHRVEVRGTDQPGIIARLAEGFAEFGANIVRLDCQAIAGGAAPQYASRFELWIPSGRAPACLASAANIAESLGLSCSSEAI